MALPWLFAAEQRETKKAVRARREQIGIEQRQADIRAQRERVRSVREARIKRATAAQAAQRSRVAITSGAVGGAAGLGTQLAAGLSFLDVTQQLARQQSIFSQREAIATSRAATYGAAYDVGVQATSIFI